MSASNETYDAIIIGAGIIGACTAFEMAKAGFRTLNVDRAPAAGYGSTSASCAIIRPYYSTIESCALAYESWFIWMNWADYIGVDDERGLITYKNTGCLVLKTEANDGMARAPALMDAIGCPYEHWTPAQIKQRLPIYDLHKFGPVKRPDDEEFGVPTGDSVDGAMFFPAGGYVSDPQLATHNAQRAAETHGAAFKFNADVTEIRRENGRVAGITLADGTRLDAPVVVNIAGPHSSKINEMAGIDGTMKISTAALRHEVAHIPAPDGFDFEKEGCVYSDSDVGTYARPELGNAILVGSEDPSCDSKEWVDADDYNEDFTEQARVQAMRLAQRIPDMGIPNRLTGVVALYDVTDDWAPIYDISDLPGFYLAIGTSGNQFKNAPVVGAMMTKLISECQAGRDHDTDPVPFRFDNVGRDISIGFFSRNREINKDSSFSVIG